MFHALSEWARNGSRGVRAGGGPGGFDHIPLHARPDSREPEVLAAGRGIRGFAEHGDIRSVRRALGVVSVLLVMAVAGLWWAL